MGPIWQIHDPWSNAGPVRQILVPFGNYRSHSADTGPIRQKWVPSGKYRSLCQILVPFGKYWSHSANTGTIRQILVPFGKDGSHLGNTKKRGILHIPPQQSEGLQTVSLREPRLRWISRCFYNS